MTVPTENPPPQTGSEHSQTLAGPVPQWLAGSGEMGKLVAAKDWSKTPLGPLESWPQSLRTAVSLCLASNFPIAIAWGPHRVQIYNDGYWPICAAKHPESMGQDFRQCWLSAWPVMGEAFERATKGEACFLVNQRMFLDRLGYLEETFFTFSFSPIRDESGGVGGLFHPVTELTQQSLAERRLHVLRKVAAEANDSQTVAETAKQIGQTIKHCELDLPFLLLYQVDSEGKTARLTQSVRLVPGLKATPIEIDLADRIAPAWPVAEAVRSGRPVQVDQLEQRFGPLNCGPYPETPKAAMVMPICLPALEHPLAVMIAGVSPRRDLDPPYRQFYDLLAEAVASAFSKARAYAEERKRAEALAEVDRAKTEFFGETQRALKQSEEKLRQSYAAIEERVVELQESRRAALNVMADAVQAKEAVRESEERFRSLVSILTDVVWTTDSAGRFIQAQPAWESYTGQSWDEYRDFGWVNALHPDDRERVKEIWNRACAEGTVYHSEGRLWHAPVKEWRYFEANGAPLLSADQTVREWVGSCRDVHAQKQAEAALRQASELLSDRAKHLELLVRQRTGKLNETIAELEGFSYTIAHDLRAPLRAMQSFANFLADDYGPQLDAQAKDYIRRIVTSAARMDRLIQDVLTYSRVARTELTLEPVDLDKLVRGILESYHHFQPPNAFIEVKSPLPTVLGNEAALTQCISNLLGNAVKFVALGVKPQIDIWSESAEEHTLSSSSSPSPLAASPQLVRLHFRDNGIGIDVQDQPKIFGMFQRLSKDYEGTGIGLSIVKKAVERMGGQLGLTSAPGTGSVFWLELQRA